MVPVDACTVLTNYGTNGVITGYTYYPNLGTSYTYAPNIGTTYSWTNYITNAVYFTNQYDNIIYGCGALAGLGVATNPYVYIPSVGCTTTNNWLVSSALSGSTAVLGTNNVLILSQGINMQGGDQFTVAQGAALSVYVCGGSVSIGGNGMVNQAGFAANLILYCSTHVTSLALGFNGSFKGIIVAPSVDVQLNGSGNNIINDFAGALMANSVTLNGHFNFHYDESLDRMAPPPLPSPGRGVPGKFILSFATGLGTAYEVDYKVSLNDPDWQELTLGIGAGTPLAVVDVATTNRSKFYRVSPKY
jgi:hypothetical protein